MKVHTLPWCEAVKQKKGRGGMEQQEHCGWISHRKPSSLLVELLR